jgi:hypothetical protein
VRIARGQVRELEFLWLGRWLSVDSGFHHFGDQVLPWLQVAHPEGSERTWSFKLDRVPHEAMLELHVVDLADMVKYPRQLQNDELRTYVSLNGQTVDPLGLNHLVPLSTKKPVRLNLAVPPELLKKGDNVLRIHQTPQQNPENLDDCGVFGIVLKLR